MNRLAVYFLATSLMFSSSLAWSITRFAEKLCHSADYFCMKVKPGDTWETLFPNPQECDIVKRVNRMNISLNPTMTIAVPKNLERLTIYDVSPFPRFIQPSGEKSIFVNQNELAWAAYGEQGELIWWGPISSGSGHCSALDGHCLTPSGSFRAIRKQDVDCISTVFPRRADGNNGGAEMPYCIHFFQGYALHGSDTLPGYRSSHGCVRMFIEDARWLNEEFVGIPATGGIKGTRVVVTSITKTNP